MLLYCYNVWKTFFPLICSVNYLIFNISVILSHFFQIGVFSISFNVFSNKNDIVSYLYCFIQSLPFEDRSSGLSSQSGVWFTGGTANMSMESMTTTGCPERCIYNEAWWRATVCSAKEGRYVLIIYESGKGN